MVVLSLVDSGMFQLTNVGGHGMHSKDWFSDMINCASGNLDMKLCLEYHICTTIFGVLYDWCSLESV